jgi:hypothetical protein
MTLQIEDIPRTKKELNAMEDGDLADLLDQFAQIEGTELGEAWQTLSVLISHYEDYISYPVRKAVRKEVVNELYRISRDFVIETEEVPMYQRKRLVLDA